MARTSPLAGRPGSPLTFKVLLQLLVLAAAAAPAWAQYKVVGPDGRVTYTDRPPADASFKVLDMGRRASAPPPPAGPPLPPALQRLNERYPVVLFAAGECPPCDAGRQLLQQRGVPYKEWRVVTQQDISALERSVGGRTLPALTVGGQALQGFAPADWTSYLDAAGYPRESQLPADWVAPVPAPLVPAAPRVAAAPPPPPAAPPPATEPEVQPSPDDRPRIRF